MLESADCQLFFRLQLTLLLFANHRLQLIPGHFPTTRELGKLPPSELAQIRDAVDADLGLIDSFVEENPARFAHDELEIVRSWRNRASGQFYICRELKKYAVFLSVEEPAIAYGVLGLSQPIHEIVPDLPIIVEAVLLPFKGQIIYDGLMSAKSLTFGPGAKRDIDERFKAAKERYGIVTSLPLSDQPLSAKPSKARSPKAQSRKAKSPEASSKNNKDEVLQVITGLLDSFCKEHLNEEYAELCRRLAEKLARKRPSPLLKGSPNAWASGIVRAIGWVNFLHDKTQTPYMKATDIDQYLGVASSTGAARSSEIRKLAKLYAFDPEWTLPSRLEDNPMVWMLEVNGFVIDVRRAARELQEQAYLQGLIPYIPADVRSNAETQREPKGQGRQRE
ncbi:MAG: DUF6398 domain-containing protein [Aureliella sp.]